MRIYKKTLLILSFVTLTIIANAQKTGFSFEPCIGLGTSESVQNGSNKLGGKIGCGLVYMFNEHWGISTELQVQRYSTKVVSGKDSVYIVVPLPPSFWQECNVNTTYNFIYLELPLILRYISSNNNKFGIFAEAGCILGYLIKGNESGTAYWTEIDTNKGVPFIIPISAGTYWSGYEESSSKSFNHITPRATSFNLQGHLALGLFIPVNNRCSIITDVSINKGFTNVGYSSNDILNPYTTPFPFYYYNKNNNLIQSVCNYGTNFSTSLSVRLNIKLGSNDKTATSRLLKNDIFSP
jgi:hypothetical protein